MKEYIWFKGGHPTKHTLDESGERPVKVFLGGGVEIRYSYYPNGNVWFEHYYKNGEAHREGDKPSFISYYSNGNVSIETYYKNGEQYRDGNKPAYIRYYPNGVVDSRNHLHSPTQNNY